MQWQRETSESDIAAENEIEQWRRRFRPQVLIEKINSFMMLLFYAEERTDPIEGFLDEVGR